MSGMTQKQLNAYLDKSIETAIRAWYEQGIRLCNSQANKEDLANERDLCIVRLKKKRAAK